MKSLARSTVLTLGLAVSASSRATTFDIATFTPPPGWQRVDDDLPDLRDRAAPDHERVFRGRGVRDQRQHDHADPDNGRGNPRRGHFRVEQVSKDAGATWTDRLCLLLERIGGEVCYNRDQ
jgi:hypothetical protein